MTDEYFYKDLADVDFREIPSFGSGTSGDPLFDALAGGNAALWDRYLELRNDKEPFPGEFEAFVEQWRNYPKVDTQINATPPLPASIRDDFLNALTTEFKSLLDVDTDWALLGFGDPQIEDVVKGAFTNFLKSFPYNPLTGPPLTSAEFFGQWKKFMTVTAVLMNATATGPKENMSSFENIFQNMFPDATSADYQATLQDFVANFIQQRGFFLPSQHVDDWTNALLIGYTKVHGASLSADERRRRNVMLLVFELLRKILERLQETVQVQANTLAFLAKYQAEYTTLMGRVPLYQANPPRLVGSASLWQDVLDSGNLNSFAYAQIKSGIGALGEGTWEDKGFAGITLKEIRSAGIKMPTMFGYTEAQIAAASALADQGLGTRLPSGRQSIPSDHVFYSLRGKEVPGVWWLVEQPYDGSGKYGGSPKSDMDHRTDLNQVRQQWIEQLRSRRDIVKDNAKQAQTNMSQTQEAITQQSDLMTAMIQQLSGIIQSIFR